MAKRGWPVVAAITFLTVSVGPGHAEDSVVGMCLSRSEAPVCECAAKALSEEIGAEAYGRYEAVGAVYLEQLAGGSEMAVAWDKALAETGEDLSETNKWGMAHQNAIRGCVGG